MDEKYRLPPPLNAAQKAQVLEAFMTTMGSLLSALCTKFPECPALKEQKQEYDMIAWPTKQIHPKIIEKWHTMMKKHYMPIAQNVTDTVLADDSNSMFRKLGIRDKWQQANFTDEDKQTLLEFIQELNELSMHYYDYRVVHLLLKLLNASEPEFEKLMQPSSSSSSSQPPSVPDFATLIANGQFQHLIQAIIFEMQINPAFGQQLQELTQLLGCGAGGPAMPAEIQSLLSMLAGMQMSM